MVKEFEKDNYWAIILGGSHGLGLASAKKLAEHGMNICVIHRDPKIAMEKIQRSYEEISESGVNIISFNADALNAERRTDILSQLKEKLGEKGKVRCLLHSIAKGNLKAMVSANEAELQTDDFQLTIQAMAISLYDWTKEIHKMAMFAKDARVLSFTSEGSKRAWKYYAAVSAAKAALEAITRGIALEMALFGIRANCIQAGVTDTNSLQMIPGSERLIKHSKERNPFKRLTEVEDIAGMVYLLCKDEAAWVNGAIIPVDGGEHVS